MRKFALFLIIAILGGLYVMQKQHEQNSQAVQAGAPQVAGPREPGEHNWMKRSLDTTRKVTGQISQQRKEDGVRN
jgi:hypothetical protein